MRWSVLFVLACGGSSATPDSGHFGDGHSSSDASNGVDGAPLRLPCTSTFGNAMTATFGRLDGFLVAIVPPGSSNCQGDASHIHLQLQVNGAIYDVAVNVG